MVFKVQYDMSEFIQKTLHHSRFTAQITFHCYSLVFKLMCQKMNHFVYGRN